MSDILRMDYINSLPHPFIARFCGDNDFWPVNDFEVGSGLMKIDACGKLEIKHFSEVREVRDGDNVSHDPDTFYTDWVHPDTDAREQIEATPGAPRWVRRDVRRK